MGDFRTMRYAVAANLENLIPAMKEAVNLLRQGDAEPSELHALLYQIRAAYTRDVLDKSARLGYGLPASTLRKQADALIKAQVE